MIIEPFLLKPIGKNYIWGGEKLKYEFNKDVDLNPLAETWECSAHPDGQSIVANGSFRGEKIGTVISQHPEILGTKHARGPLPILVKLIDAKSALSVQVHPDDEYAHIHEKQNGKTEMWYVLDAEDGAVIYRGFNQHLSLKQFKKIVSTGDLGKYLNKIVVHKGDICFIPAGMVHAIGAGIILAEIQESSNVTYRVFDYNRVDKNGKKRALDIEKACDVINLSLAPKHLEGPLSVSETPGFVRELLCSCEYFESEKITVKASFDFYVSEDSFQVLLAVEGKGQFETNSQTINLRKGDCVFVPADSQQCTIKGEITVLKINC